MVVLTEGLGQLVAGVVARRDDAHRDAGLFERGQVPVDGADGQPLAAVDDLGDREWAVGGGQNLDDRPSTRGVALRDAT